MSWVCGRSLSLVLVQPEDREDVYECFSRYSCWTVLLKATAFPIFISLTGYGRVFERVKVVIKHLCHCITAGVLQEHKSSVENSSSNHPNLSRIIYIMHWRGHIVKYFYPLS